MLVADSERIKLADVPGWGLNLRPTFKFSLMVLIKCFQIVLIYAREA